MADRMSKAEFIALIAMMFATIAFSIDSMLPALPEIGAQLSPDDVNRAQLILTSVSCWVWASGHSSPARFPTRLDASP